MTRRGSVVALVAFLLAVPGTAAAQSPAELEQARKTFAQGEEAEAHGDCETAIAQYEAVAVVKETPAVRLRIGRCQERTGRLLLALAAYQRAVELAQADPRALEVATAMLEALDPRIPRLAVQLVGEVEDATVTIDGVTSTATDAQRVDPGAHVVAARAPGRTPFEERVELAEGETRVVDVVFRPIAGAPPPPAPPPETPVDARPFPWVPVTLYATGAVALGVAIPLLATSVVDDSDLDALCFDEAGRPSEDRDPCFRADGGTFSDAERAAFEDDRGSVDTRQGMGWALAGAGLAAAGIATVILLTDGEGAATMGFRIDAIDAMASPDEAGLWVGGTF